MAFTPTFFSRTATAVISVALLVVLLWAIYMLAPIALDRWFG